ncbi:MAG TPA: glycosyltransferase family 4 protein [Candidatus Nanoarchaeia archaeon]|nr:glycosyltransferase family 4 protein [Candidatus Nanoarchaeia archaeon]
MKILFISPYYEPVRGGMETHVASLAKELVKRGHDVHVFTSDLSREGRISQKQETIEGVHVKRFTTWFKLGQFASFFPGIFFAIRKLNPDIIHVHNFRHPSNLAPFFTKRPCFLTFHWPQYPRGLRTPVMDFFSKLFDKTLARPLLEKYKKVCAVTISEVPFIQAFNVPQEKILLTPNAIPKAYLIPQERRSFRVKHHLKEKDFVVLSLSRIHKSKGFDLVVQLAARYPQIKFVIAGRDEGHKHHLEDLAKALNTKNVFFIGELTDEDKIKAYASCDVFLHPSHFEAFGIVALEAMSQAKPVITSNSGGLPWVVGDAGLTFKDNNLHDLEDKFKRILYSPSLRKELGKKAYRRATTLTWNNVAEHLEKAYKGIL